MKEYFALLNHPNQSPVPLVDDDGIMYFETLKEAKDTAKTSSLGDHYGAEIFQLGLGESSI